MTLYIAYHDVELLSFLQPLYDVLHILLKSFSIHKHIPTSSSFFLYHSASQLYWKPHSPRSKMWILTKANFLQRMYKKKLP